MYYGQGFLDILKTTHEDTSNVRMSKLKLLTTKFENLKMKDDEFIQDFHMNILDIENAFVPSRWLKGGLSFASYELTMHCGPRE